VKQKFVYLPIDCVNKNHYGEMESVIFALTHFTKHMMPSCKSVTIFFDISILEQIIDGEATFENPSLMKLQKEMVFLYQKVKLQNSNLKIEVKYLPGEHKKYNPFYQSSIMRPPQC
jgi:hypothetical protein